MKLRNLLAAVVVAGLGAGAAPAAAGIGGDLRDIEPPRVAEADPRWYQPCLLPPNTWRPYSRMALVMGLLPPPRWPCWRPPFPYRPLWRLRTGSWAG